MSGRSLIAALFALVALGAVGCQPPREAPPQPLPFDHVLHATVERDGKPLACIDCHPGAERGTHAGLPALAVCLTCHMRPQGDPPSDDEVSIRDTVRAGGPFRWIQVTRNPSHVHFSHGQHVTGAGYKCEDCHRDVANWRTPPTVPDVHLTSMNACLSCHRERGAPTECGTCHQ